MSEHTGEIVQEMRGIVARGLVVAVDDTGPMMTVDVQTQTGLTRAGIEVYQFAGFACAPVLPGAVVLLLGVGADPGDLVALGPVVPAARFGGLLAGEAVIYNLSDGSRIAFRQGGACELRSATSILVETSTVTVNASGGATVTADVSIVGNVTLAGSATVLGNLSVAGNVSDSIGSMASIRSIYDAHQHADPQGGLTSTPSILM